MQRKDGFETAGVALAPATAIKLAVYTAGLIAIGGDNVQAAALGNTLLQLDVGAPAGHIGCHGDRAGLPGASDDLRLEAVLAGIEDTMVNTRPGQNLTQLF